MSEKKKHFYKTLNNIVATNRVDNEEAYIINDYIGGLEMQLQQKENIIKEVREFAKLRKERYERQENVVGQEVIISLLNILDKGE